MYTYAVKFFSSTFGMMVTKDSVHTGIHAHRHACALHMRVATTVSAMNAKGCARWCHMRPTVRRAAENAPPARFGKLPTLCLERAPR